MKKYLKEYVEQLETEINSKKKMSEEEIKRIEVKISFFQHERLIHLVVTIAFAFFTLLFMALGMLSYVFLVSFFFLVVFLIFYILHYFYLENHVQYLYKLYDEVILNLKK